MSTPGLAPETDLFPCDLHSTILHFLGLGQEELTSLFQGLDQKLTGVEPARVIRELLA